MNGVTVKMKNGPSKTFPDTYDFWAKVSYSEAFVVIEHKASYGSRSIKTSIPAADIEEIIEEHERGYW